ncbi:MAG TPA: serine hydrolase domain-containing protein [Caulobacteraceae bacterium]|jgi:CubicO group peptidase (beta-lactamase class C family)|nr:serine hydrolase domain-containing protein [Caulobacteraceae bacterium]
MTVRFLCLAFLATVALCLGGSAQPASRGSDYAARANALLIRHLAAGDFSGVVIVAVHGRPLLRRAYGSANREWNAPVTPDTVFRIGSTTKQFTAAAIMQLVEAGKVRLDDPIGAYVQNTPPSWAGITLRHLLTHTSGIPDYTQANGFIRITAPLNLKPDQIVDLVRNQPLDFAPGSKFQYDNTGYVLLGMVIERVSGESYGDYIRVHVLRPLGLDQTAYDDAADIVPRRAAGYWLSDGVVKNARAMTTSLAYAAGGLRSTADDLLRWDQALHSGKLLRPESVAAMFTDYGHGYGFGAFVETRHGHRLWDHGGNLPGFSSAFEHFPDDGLTVIVLTNIEGQGSEKLAAQLEGLYFGWPPPAKSPP